MDKQSVMQMVQAECWAMPPERLSALLAMVASGRVQALERPSPLKQGNVAVLPLVGAITHRDSMLARLFGMGTVQGFLRQFRAAVSDPTVKAVVLDIDSPGGTVDGVPELADAVYQARGSKHIVAVANTLAASAAYWIASAADEVVVTPSGEVGSIGVYAVHEDYSGALEQAGIKATIIKAGKHKAEGSPYEPLSDEAKDYMQARIDAVYQQFVAGVARGRGASVRDVREGYGQGRTMGAKEAVAAGLADRVATLEEVITGLVGRSARVSGIAASEQIKARLRLAMAG